VNTEIVERSYLAEIQQIIDTPSVMPPPAIHGTRDKSLASSLADSLQLGEVGRSMQRMLVYPPLSVEAYRRGSRGFDHVDRGRSSRRKSFEISVDSREHTLHRAADLAELQAVGEARRQALVAVPWIAGGGMTEAYR